jgi:hypothetical protein
LLNEKIGDNNSSHRFLVFTGHPSRPKKTKKDLVNFFFKTINWPQAEPICHTIYKVTVDPFSFHGHNHLFGTCQKHARATAILAPGRPLT